MGYRPNPKRNLKRGRPLNVLFGGSAQKVAPCRWHEIAGWVLDVKNQIDGRISHMAIALRSKTMGKSH